MGLAGRPVPAPAATRRQVLRGAAGWAAGLAAAAGRAGAEAPPPLPRGYVKLTGELAGVLRETIELEASGATEAEVRKARDPAKALIKDYLGNYGRNPAVAGSPSYKDLSGALADLGKFYAKNGQRTPLPVDVRDSILAQIAAAEEELRALEGAKK